MLPMWPTRQKELPTPALVRSFVITMTATSAITTRAEIATTTTANISRAAIITTVTATVAATTKHQ